MDQIELVIEDLPPAITGTPEPAPAPAPATDAPTVQTLAEAERGLVAAALRKTGGNKNEAARILGIDRQRLYRKIEKYGL